MKSISDEIYEAILGAKREFEAREILKRFFKIRTDRKDLAEKNVGTSSPRTRDSGVRGTVSGLPSGQCPLRSFHCARRLSYSSR